jgi:hypothetical protein
MIERPLFGACAAQTNRYHNPFSPKIDLCRRLLNSGIVLSKVAYHKVLFVQQSSSRRETPAVGLSK